MTIRERVPLVLHPGRRLDLETVDAFRGRCEALRVDRDTDVLVDLRDTEQLDVAGLAALVNLLVRCREGGGSVSLIGPIAPPVRRLLDYSGFLPQFGAA